MGKFLETEKPKQVAFKQASGTFTPAARADGYYRTKYRPFCLPRELAEQNLFPGIREFAPAHFARHGIKWHDGQDSKPSNHMCDSQVCCVNFLFPLANQPQALAKILQPFFPQIERMLPVEDDLFVSFEWIGAQNYLKEKTPRSRMRSRGANYTSADAIVLFERTDKKRQAVLIEWKYSESYGGTDLKFAKSGTDRREIYRHLFDAADCPIDPVKLPGFDSLFYEPFYQLMRQQFLAHEMEKARELSADIVSLLHIAPAQNEDFKRVTSACLKDLGDSPTGIWKTLVIPPDRFLSISTEQLFGHLPAEELPEMQGWLDYIYERYSWVNEA